MHIIKALQDYISDTDFLISFKKNQCFYLLNSTGGLFFVSTGRDLPFSSKETCGFVPRDLFIFVRSNKEIYKK